MYCLLWGFDLNTVRDSRNAGVDPFYQEKN
jgi:hypothetical protein